MRAKEGKRGQKRAKEGKRGQKRAKEGKRGGGGGGFLGEKLFLFINLITMSINLSAFKGADTKALFEVIDRVQAEHSGLDEDSMLEAETLWSVMTRVIDEVNRVGLLPHITPEEKQRQKAKRKKKPTGWVRLLVLRKKRRSRAAKRTARKAKESD